MRIKLTALLVVLMLVGIASANPFMGEYKGTFHPDGAVTMKATAKVIAEGDDVHYRIVIKAIPNKEGQDGAAIEIYGNKAGTAVQISDRAGGYHWSGDIRNGHLTAKSGYGQHFELDKFVRKSPTLAAKPPAGAVVLLPQSKGKADLAAWKNQDWKKLDAGVMAVNKGDNDTNEQFSNIKQFHLEFKLPLEPNNRGQGRANSGVYFCGQFEVQVLDSFGLMHTSGDCGGLYNRARAKVNACLPPEQWQTYDVTFKAPKLDATGKVIGNAHITVRHNGLLIQDIDLDYSGDKWKGKKIAAGPIHLQDHGHPIQYRNIWLVKGK